MTVHCLHVMSRSHAIQSAHRIQNSRAISHKCINSIYVLKRCYNNSGFMYWNGGIAWREHTASCGDKPWYIKRIQAGGHWEVISALRWDVPLGLTYDQCTTDKYESHRWDYPVTHSTDHKCVCWIHQQNSRKHSGCTDSFSAALALEQTALSALALRATALTTLALAHPAWQLSHHKLCT